MAKHDHSTTAHKPSAQSLSDADRLTAGLANLARLRKEAAAHIERLLELLDATQPVADLEPEEDCDLAGSVTDREEDDSDREPSLCGITAAAQHYRGGVEDGERNDDDHDDDTEHEPELGWTTDGAIGDPRHLEMNGGDFASSSGPGRMR